MWEREVGTYRYTGNWTVREVNSEWYEEIVGKEEKDDNSGSKKKIRQYCYQRSKSDDLEERKA